MIDADKLRALIAKATDSDLSDDGRYFHEDCSDMTQCGHGDTGEYRNRHDGKLVELLWNNRAAILAMVEREKRMREALERAGLRFDMLAPLVIAGNSKLAVTKWANEARAGALGEAKA